MTQPPLIAVTTYGRNDAGRFDLPAEYVECVRRAGGVPLLVPPGEFHIEAVLERVDGLLLTGGGDVGPGCYGGPPHPTLERVDPARDGTELSLLAAVLAAGRPCLGVCRGIQVLNVALGGTLVQHLPEATDGSVAHKGASGEPVPHAVELVPTSRLAAITGARRISPLSKHHQALGDLGAGLVVTARAPDGVIEAVELTAGPWLVAVQWHPELTAADDPAQQRLFDAFVAQAAAAAAERAGSPRTETSPAGARPPARRAPRKP